MIVRCRDIFFIAMMSILCVPTLLAAETDFPIRVSFFQNGAASCRVEVASSFQMQDGDHHNVILKGDHLGPTIIRGNRRGIFIGDQHVHTNHLVIVPSKNGTLRVNGKSYRGHLVVYVIADELVFVVNHVKLEDYLKGVLAGEMPRRWDDNALRAQAIAARTYALYQAGLKRDRLYDVTNDIFSQVYGGIANESPKTNRIIKETEGVVMIYRGGLFPAYFHSCCGGKTEYARDVWEDHFACLRSVVCAYCEDAPHFQWQANISFAKIRKALEKRYGAVPGTIRHMRINKQSKSGRNKTIAIETHDRKEYTLETNEFRLLTDPRLIKSTRFHMDVQDHKIQLRGQGWGHGVGLCQWGAKGYAEHNYLAEEILHHYYPGTELVQIQ